MNLILNRNHLCVFVYLFRFSRCEIGSNRTSFVFSNGKFIGLSIKGTVHFCEVCFLRIPYSSRKCLQRFVVFLPCVFFLSNKGTRRRSSGKICKILLKEGIFPGSICMEPSFLLSSENRPSINYLLKSGEIFPPPLPSPPLFNIFVCALNISLKQLG